MADSACLIQAFSYASATPNESKQGNAMHALGESISFGRFMSESLAWEKWSAFAHNSNNSNKYVEEAVSYARPGMVAQKKAFFEAHYKRIAAKKAAAAAAALALEQANAYAAAGGDEEGRRCKPDSDVRVGDEAQETVSGSEEVSETPQMERPLLKSCSKKMEVEEEEEVSSSAPVITKRRPALSTLKMPIHGNTRNKVPPPPPPLAAAVRPTTIRTPPNNKENIIAATPKRIPPAVVKSCNSTLSLGAAKLPSKSLSSLFNLTPPPPIEPDDKPLPPPTNKDTPRFAPKKCSTPLLGMMRTPMQQQEKPVNPASASRSTKTSAPKWQLLTSACAKSLTACRNKLRSPYTTNTSLTPTPFRLRTEERATARRKQKLEEKFNAKKVEEEEVQKVLLQTKLKEKKAGAELRRKLGQSLCFKARPLPHFYHKDDKTRREEEPPPQPPAAKRQQSPKNPGATQPSAQPLARKSRPKGTHARKVRSSQES